MEPFAFLLIRQFLTSEEDQMLDLQPVGDREFYSVFAILVLGVIVLALTSGLYALRGNGLAERELRANNSLTHP